MKIVEKNFDNIPSSFDTRLIFIFFKNIRDKPNEKTVQLKMSRYIYERQKNVCLKT